MPQIHVKLNYQHPMHIVPHEYDSYGIKRDPQKLFGLLFMILCRNSDKSIEIESVAVCEVGIDRLKNIPENKRLETVSYHGSHKAIQMLKKRPLWELYQPQEVTLDGENFEEISKIEEMNADIEITDTLEKYFKEATTRHNECKVAFDRAKKYLEENIEYLRYDPSQAMAAAQYIAQCMRADGTFYMGGWNNEKSSYLTGWVDELVKRKNTNNDNYRRIVDSLRSVLYRVHCPSVWNRHPNAVGGFN